MGLDQFAYTTKEEINKILAYEPQDKIEFCHIKNYYDLNDLVIELYSQEGGEEEFNEVGIHLSETDLLDFKIIAELKSFSVEELEFIDQALKLTKAGEQVYYISWY